MKKPKVSVVIGSYNCEKFIQETIQSVINQTFQDWELIVVDDCSTDNTCQKINEIKDDRIRLIKLDSNSGLPAVPRNIAMRNAKGDYIAFLDHDDLWLPKKLEKQVAAMEQDEDIYLVYTKCIIQRDGKQLKISPQKPKSGYVFHDLFLHFNFIDCLTVMIRNKSEENNYYFDEDKGFVAVEDYALWLLIAKDHKIFCVDEPLAIYRIHSEGLSSGAFKNFKRCLLVIKKFAPFVSKTMQLRAYSHYYANLLYVGILSILMKTKRSLIGGRHKSFERKT